MTAPQAPEYLGAVLSDNGEPMGTCFQVAELIAITAWHVVAGIEFGDKLEYSVKIRSLSDPDKETSAYVEAANRDHDIAILRLSRRLPGVARSWFASNLLRLGASVQITGVANVDDGHSYEFLNSPALWMGNSARDGIPISRAECKSLMPGMSGSPIMTMDQKVIGVVRERYISADGFLRDTIWAASSETVSAALRGIASISLEGPRLSREALNAIIPDGEAIARRLLGGRATDRPSEPAEYLPGPIRLHSAADSLLQGDVRRLIGDLLQSLGQIDQGLAFISRNRSFEALISDAVQLVSQDEIVIDAAGDFPSERLAARLLEEARVRAGGPKIDTAERVVMREILTSCIEALMRHHLSLMPAVGARNHLADGSASTQHADDRAREGFEALYFAEVARQLERVTVAGLTLNQRQKDNYQLSTSYVNLAMQLDSEQAQSTHAGSIAVRTGMTVEQVLQGRRLVVIEGPAGAGKTTLLRRLALYCAYDAVPSALADIRGCVPFFLPARKLDPRNLPKPEGFVGAFTEYEGVKPDGWVTKVLISGRGLVLLDGIDEVAVSLRPRLLNWAANLAESFPRAKFVLTTRPSAVGGDLQEYLQSKGFMTAAIEPMSSQQVDEFISRWHLPSTDGTDRYTTQDIEHAANGLRATLLGRRDLRRLATTPLLCAMLCALNFNSGQYLPRSRTQLYRNSLEMLLERRDFSKQVSVTESFYFDHEQSALILRRLAYWMAVEGSRWIHREVALREISDVIPTIRGAFNEVPKPAEVLDYLVERSGILQEPTIDTLEFTHPSFQDFLAASEAVARTHVRILLDNVSDPLYRDLIVMSIGISSNTNSDYFDRLLSSLVNIGEQKQGEFERLRRVAAEMDADRNKLATPDTHREADRANVEEKLRAVRADSLYVWFLLATSMSDLAVGDKRVEDRISSATRDYLPPNSLEDAQMLADVGAFVLDALGEVVASGPLTDRQEIATVQVAALISSDEALPLLTQFRSTQNQAVREILLGAIWNITDREAYARDVLSHIPAGANLSAVINDATSFDIVSSLWSVGSIEFLDICTDHDFIRIQYNPWLKRLVLAESSITDLSPIRQFPNLEVLDLSDADVADLTALVGLGHLRELLVPGTRISSLSPVSELPSLHIVDGSETQIRRVGELSQSRSIETLRLSATPIATLTGIEGMTQLKELDLFGTLILDLEPLQGLANVEVLNIGGTSVRSLRPLASLKALQVLYMESTDARDLRPLLSLPALSEVHLDGSELAFRGVRELRDKGVTFPATNSG